MGFYSPAEQAMFSLIREKQSFAGNQGKKIHAGPAWSSAGARLARQGDLL